MRHFPLPMVIVAIGAAAYLLFAAIDKFFPKIGNRIFPRPKMDLSVNLCKKCKGFPCACICKTNVGAPTLEAKK